MRGGSAASFQRRPHELRSSPPAKSSWKSGEVLIVVPRPRQDAFGMGATDPVSVASKPARGGCGSRRSAAACPPRSGRWSLIGAALTIALTYLLWVESWSLYAVLVVALATFI